MRAQGARGRQGHRAAAADRHHPVVRLDRLDLRAGGEPPRDDAVRGDDQALAVLTLEHAEGILTLSGLQTQFHVKDRVYRAVGGVDLAVKPGECLGIIGESGSGKTVTAMSLTGLVASPPGRITAGEVWFDGMELLSASDEAIRGIRAMFRKDNILDIAVGEEH